MKTSSLDKLRAAIEGDPAAEVRWQASARNIRPKFLEMQAAWESWFPPESPSSKRRGGSKLAPSQEFIDAVCAILDAKTGNDFHLPDFEEAMRSADEKFFLMLAEAAKYVRGMSQAQSTFANHVVAARRIAADMMGSHGPLPSKSEVKAAVFNLLGQEAFGIASPEWSRVWSAAGLKDLPR